MNESFGKKFILNGELHPSEFFDNSLVYEGESIYEVIRLVKGNPVFFNGHMERLAASVSLQSEVILADIPTLKKAIIGLNRSDKKKETNIKIVFNYNRGIHNYLVYYIESSYPTEEQYRKGVKGILFFAERKDPEAKVINHKLRSSIYHKLIQEAGYEALLVNENNQITEGSRSNIFFLKGDTLFTAPDNVILNGITRKHIIEICLENKIEMVFKCVNASELPLFDAVFMTGTSPKVLPFNNIGNHIFNVRLPIIEKLRQLYTIKAEESIRLFISEE
jgi:branched-chain amino acid aminotransferase